LKLIQDVLTIAVPQFRELQLKRDDNTGAPHLEVVYQHWRSNKAGRQDENQFSDGTLRLIGLLWALQEGSGLLLMEEPELSLHKGIVTQLAAFIHRAQMRSKRSPRQVFISTHSVDLLSAEGIDAQELLIFRPSDNGTSVSRGDQIDTVRSLMESGLSAAEAAIPQTESPEFVQLRLINL
jgi:predicted ATPase